LDREKATVVTMYEWRTAWYTFDMPWAMTVSHEGASTRTLDARIPVKRMEPTTSVVVRTHAWDASG
jgi:hypothetical protein